MMKSIMGRIIYGALAATMVLGVAMAGEFHSDIITTSTLTVNVNDEHSMRIFNFTQEGGTQRALVTVTTSAGTANVLSAAIIDPTASPTPAPLEPISQVVIAGPATVTVAPVGGATVFITYRRQSDGDGGKPSSNTPTPTPTP